MLLRLDYEVFQGIFSVNIFEKQFHNSFLYFFASLFSYLQKEDEVLGFSEIKYAGLKNWKHFRWFRSGSEKATVMMDSLLKLPVMIYTENIYIKQVYSASAPSLVTFPGHMWNSLNFIKRKACFCFPLIFNDSSLRCFCVCFSRMRFEFLQNA